MMPHRALKRRSGEENRQMLNMEEKYEDGYGNEQKEKQRHEICFQIIEKRSGC